MNIVIIEDEAIAVERLKNMLRELDRDIRVVHVSDTVESSVQYLKQSPQIDLIFMDVELCDGQSFGIFNHIQVDTPVIFITAYQQYALKAFKQNSIDYLLKPLHKEELASAILKYRRMQSHPSKTTMVRYDEERVVSAVAERKTRFLTKLGTRLMSVPVESIAYFYTRDKMLYIKTKNNEDFIFDKSLEDVESEIDNRVFFRVNRQFIIHYDTIEKVHAWFGGKLKVQVHPSPYEEIIISRLRAGEFRKWLGE
jgi:two-component system, LytTR family, response regulator LytT